MKVGMKVDTLFKRFEMITPTMKLTIIIREMLEVNQIKIMIRIRIITILMEERSISLLEVIISVISIAQIITIIKQLMTIIAIITISIISILKRVVIIAKKYIKMKAKLKK